MASPLDKKLCIIFLIVMKDFQICQDVNHKLPLSLDGSDMYEKMDDGILLCKVFLVNLFGLISRNIWVIQIDLLDLIY